MANLARLLGLGNLHPRETIFGNAPAIAAVNGEVIVDCDGANSFALDLRDTFNLTMVVEGTIDGSNWIAVPMKPVNQASVLWTLAVAGSTQGVWVGECYGFRKLRARCSAWTSGSANVTLATSLALMPISAGSNYATTGLGTTVGAAGAAATLTLASPGAGLRHYLTYLRISRYAAAVLTASATPVTITTTNLPGTLAFTAEADAAQLGTRAPVVSEDFAAAIAANAQATATTIVCPAITGVIWRITAGFYPAP
jgi:hypothetical protein